VPLFFAAYGGSAVFAIAGCSANRNCLSMFLKENRWHKKAFFFVALIRCGGNPVTGAVLHEVSFVVDSRTLLLSEGIW